MSNCRIPVMSTPNNTYDKKLNALAFAAIYFQIFHMLRSFYLQFRLRIACRYISFIVILFDSSNILTMTVGTLRGIGRDRMRRWI